MQYIKQTLVFLSLLTLFLLISQKQYAATLPMSPVPGTLVVTNQNCIQPPDQSVVDHATLSDADLQKYGLPPRSWFSDQNQWADIVRHANHAQCSIIAYPDIHIKGGTNTGTQYDPHWSGYEEHGTNFPEGTSYWTVPSVTSGTAPWQSSWPARAMQFVGVGGTVNNRLVQVGTMEATYEADNLVWPFYVAFYENYGNVSGTPGFNGNYSNEAYLFNFTDGAPHAGDTMWGEVYNNIMYLLDYTTGDYTNPAFQFGPTPDVHTWECIHELPWWGQFGVTINYLTMTSSYRFTRCQGTDIYGTTYEMGSGNFNYNPVYLENTATGHILEYPSGLFGGGDFTMTFLNQQ